MIAQEVSTSVIGTFGNDGTATLLDMPTRSIRFADQFDAALFDSFGVLSLGDLTGTGP